MSIINFVEAGSLLHQHDAMDHLRPGVDPFEAIAQTHEINPGAQFLSGVILAVPDHFVISGRV